MYVGICQFVLMIVAQKVNASPCFIRISEEGGVPRNAIHCLKFILCVDRTAAREREDCTDVIRLPGVGSSSSSVFGRTVAP